VRIRRWVAGRGAVNGLDEVAREQPLEVRVDTRSVAVVMRTPGHDEELAADFLVSEGLLRSRDQIGALRPHPRNRAGNVIDVFLKPDVSVDFGALTRHVFAASSCGLCGKASIRALRGRFPKIASRVKISATTVTELPVRMAAARAAFSRTGGLHAAALFSGSGELPALREDVGRHNAVDKLLGGNCSTGGCRFPGTCWWSAAEPPSRFCKRRWPVVWRSWRR
jgi:FdhD protein